MAVNCMKCTGQASIKCHQQNSAFVIESSFQGFLELNILC